MECSREVRFLSGRTPQFYTGMGAVSARNRQDPPESVCNRHQPIDASRSFRHDGGVGERARCQRARPLDSTPGSSRRRTHGQYLQARRQIQVRDSLSRQERHRRKKTGATDKQVTERIARDLENRIILLKEGTINPKAEAYRDHEAKPLAAHLVDFEAALVARGNTRNHCVATVSRIKKVLSLAKFKLVSDLSVSGASTRFKYCEPEASISRPSITTFER